MLPVQNSAAVFLDRDGVMIEDVHYLSDVGQVRLIPGAAEAIAKLNAAGVAVVVVTNQSGVARGYFSEDRVGEVHARLDELLAECRGRVDRYYYCPHHPDAEVELYRAACECRKPKPGMLHRAAAELGLNLARAYLVGDKASDLAAGGAAGCKTVLVRTGYGARVDVIAGPKAWNLVRVAADLDEAVRHTLAEIKRARLKQSA
jgi:D-glycero-D-manno-heptose 1,7-bisphosphate phosphatase